MCNGMGRDCRGQPQCTDEIESADAFAGTEMTSKCAFGLVMTLNSTHKRDFIRSEGEAVGIS